MSALANRSNPVLDALKPTFTGFAWECLDDIEKALGDMTIPIHVHVMHIPINVDVKITSIEGLVEKVLEAFVGPDPSKAPAAPAAPSVPAPAPPAS